MPEANTTETPEIAAILNSARDIDSAANAVISGPQPEPAEVIDPAEAWADIPRQVGKLLCIAAPELADVYTEKACKQWGKDMHRVAVKRGWSTDGLPPEVAAAISTGGFLLPSFFVIRAKVSAARKARQDRAQAEAAAASPEAAAAAAVSA
jgi:hypothetical protein